MKIMVIEDEAIWLDNFRVMLRAKGCTVRCVAQVKRVAEAAKEFKPQGIIIDYSLIDGTGIDALVELGRTLERLPPFVFYTNYPSGSLQQEELAKKKIGKDRIFEKNDLTEDIELLLGALGWTQFRMEQG